ncbi:MAG: DUF2860 domain-containing protein [Helicobacter sp.]|nr:DUF2860 domain-containing protein [Helicobacter sp.]
MKKIFLTCLCASLFAEGSPSTQFSIILGGGIQKLKSNISTQTKSFLQNYDVSQRDSFFFPLLGFEFDYQESGHQIFLKNYNGRNLSGISMGYSKSYDTWKTTLKLISSLREQAYENPYQIGDRNEIDVLKIALEITQDYRLGEYQRIFVSYLLANNLYEKETMPFDALKRESIMQQFEIGLDWTLVHINAFVDYNNAEGSAETFGRVGFELGGFWKFENDVVLSPNMSVARQIASNKNPIFDAKNNATILQISLNLTKLQLFNQPNLFGYAHYGFENRHSEISFLNESFSNFLLGVGFRF